MLLRQALSLFVFSVAVLSLELSYTKFFSVLLWYHFGFLIVSSAMLGFAAAGVVLALLGERRHRLSLFPLINASALVVLVSYAVLTRIDATPISMSPSAATLSLLVLIAGLLFLPFLAMGLAVSWVISAQKENVGVIYGANLVGSALGALLFIFLFDHFSGEITPFINVMLMLAASLFLLRSKAQLRTWLPLVLVTVPLLFSGRSFEMDPARYKVLGAIKNRDQEVLFSGWSSLSKVDIFRDPDRNVGYANGLWGLSRPYVRAKKPLPERLGVVIDASAYTTIMKYPQPLGFYDALPSTFVFHLGRNFRRSLHIGAGGGMDLLGAHHYGVEDVHGVEINPLIVKAVRGQFSDFSGGIYNGGIEGVEVHVSEGRSFLERSDEKYDLIQLSGVDTQSSSQAGAFALSENYLYTREAFVSYLRHLAPGGMLTLTRWHFPDREGRKTYSLRMLNIVKEALEEVGVNPLRRVFNFREAEKGIITLLAVQLEPFSREQIGRGIEYIEKNHFTPMVIPGRRFGNVYEKFLYAKPDRYRRLLEDYPYLVSPPTDNRPFIFELQRLASVFRNDDWPVRSATITGQEILLVILAELALMGVLLLILPLRYLARKSEVRIPWKANVYFSLIGFAYISVEIVMSQKLVLYLGHPTYALSVVIAGMLFSSGVASAWSGRLGEVPRYALLALAPLLGLVALLMSPVLDASLQMSFAARLGVTMLFLAPLAFLMGFAFPLGIRKVREEFVPYLWGVNGFFSVVGSVLAVIVSINYGFLAVFAAATLAYALAASLGGRKNSTLA